VRRIRTADRDLVLSDDAAIGHQYRDETPLQIARSAR
jgi:hypothetical protein